MSYPALPHYTSPYPSLVVPYLYTSALSPVTTTKFKFKFYSIMSPPKRIPHLALSIVTAYPKSYLSIYNPFLFDPPPRLPFLNRYLWGAVLLFVPYLWISKIHFRISIIHFWISIIHFWISKNEFRISQNNYGYPKLFLDIQKCILGYP